MLTGQGVFTEAELKSRLEVSLENYCKTIVIEANTMVSMARTEIAPAMEAYLTEIAKAAMTKKELDPTLPRTYETELIQKLSTLTVQIAARTDELSRLFWTWSRLSPWNRKPMLSATASCPKCASYVFPVMKRKL